jgi:hypothetical protein
MKKYILAITMAATMTFGLTSCSKDDDKNNCDTCSALMMTVEICDNGDDTYTLTAGGQSETLSLAELEGLAPDEFIGVICDLSNLTP